MTLRVSKSPQVRLPLRVSIGWPVDLLFDPPIYKVVSRCYGVPPYWNMVLFRAYGNVHVLFGQLFLGVAFGCHVL